MGLGELTTEARSTRSRIVWMGWLGRGHKYTDVSKRIQQPGPKIFPICARSTAACSTCVQLITNRSFRRPHGYDQFLFFSNHCVNDSAARLYVAVSWSAKMTGGSATFMRGQQQKNLRNHCRRKGHAHGQASSGNSAKHRTGVRRDE